MILLLDTAHRKGLVALGNEGKIVEEQLLENSDTLGEVVRELIRGIKLQRIGVGRGPGSYTGIRVGAALATGMAVKGLPMVPFCSLQGHIPNREGSFVAAFDARHGGAYFLRGERQGEQIRYGGDPELGPLPEGWIVSPDLDQLGAEGEQSQPNALHLLKIVERGKPAPLIDPLYLRRTEAERKLSAARRKDGNR